MRSSPRVEQIEGIAGADLILGRRFPLPALALPLARWTAVAPLGGGVEIEWNLDDSREGTPGRIALYVGAVPAPPQELPDPTAERDAAVRGLPARLRTAPLDEAQPSLRPVRELTWERGGLYLRLTAQGPWELEELFAIAASTDP
jgi:hypothetical protein